MKKMMLILLVFLLGSTVVPSSLLAQEELTLKQLQFYEGPDLFQERDQRKYYDSFARSTARYIFCEVEALNLLYGKALHNHKVVWEYYNPDGSLRGRISDDWNVQPEWYTTWVQRGWGWDSPGNWPAGTYTVRVLVDGLLFAKGRFIIYEDRPVFQFINTTTTTLTLYVDGERKCTAAPGGQCTDWVTIGQHEIRAVSPDGRYSSRNVYIDEAGFKWTLYE